MARSLCGLSLSGNPLEFPPSHIIQKGTQVFDCQVFTHTSLKHGKFVATGKSYKQLRSTIKYRNFENVNGY